ncbi:hypothetical protein BDW59DRAFT_159070 [Aspergillus cavernicola]|uniref:Uncharacterized protein n=1 Tax=Aspergillus cavernicola TaxID=176166 RepID=A0ABR4IRG3_9EURO
MLDEAMLLNTATAFLQGLYPSLVGLNKKIASQTLNNGTTYTNPLSGDDECPAMTELVESFTDSVVYQERVESSRPFYQQFWPGLQDVYL